MAIREHQPGSFLHFWYEVGKCGSPKKNKQKNCFSPADVVGSWEKDVIQNRKLLSQKIGIDLRCSYKINIPQTISLISVNAGVRVCMRVCLRASTCT